MSGNKEFGFGNALPTIPESEFRKYLKVMMDPVSSEASRRKWLDICIDTRLRVNVVDDVTGTYLHYVPPITYTSDCLTGRNISGSIVEWMMHNEVSPLHGNLFAKKFIKKNLVLGEVPQADKDMWTKIMVRYGYHTANAESSSNEVIIGGDSDDW